MRRHSFCESPHIGEQKPSHNLAQKKQTQVTRQRFDQNISNICDLLFEHINTWANIRRTDG